MLSRSTAGGEVSASGLNWRQVVTVSTATAPKASQNGAVMPRAAASAPPSSVPSAAPPRSNRNRRCYLITRPCSGSGTSRWRSEMVTTPQTMARRGSWPGWAVSYSARQRPSPTSHCRKCWWAPSRAWRISMGTPATWTTQGSPASSVTIVRERDQGLDYLVLVDSVIVLDGPSELKVVTDRRVDAVAQAEESAIREHPIGSPAHQARADELVAAQRRHRNQPGGYWLLGPSRRRHMRRWPGRCRDPSSPGPPFSATVSLAWWNAMEPVTGAGC